MLSRFKSMLSRFGPMLSRFRSMLSRLFSREEATGGLPFALPRDVSGALHQAVLMIERQAEDRHYCVALTACRHGAGTSTLAWSLARTFADMTGKDIVLVEANMQSPILAKVLGLREEPGFHELVAGPADMGDVVQRPGGERFSVITAGDCIDAKGKIFSQPSFERALGKIRARFPISIVDAPPLLIYPDTLSLTGGFDGLIMVLKAGSDEWEVAKLAKQAVAGTSTDILGAILNRKKSYIPDWLN